MSDLVHLDHDGAIAIVTLDRPPANALNLDMLDALLGLLPRLRHPDVRAVVLRGQGRFFSAGLDLFQVFAYDQAEARRFTTVFDDTLAGWFSLDRPVVAAVGGHAIAGGLVLAALADFRLAADGDAKLGLTETPVGVPFPASALEVVRFSFAGPWLNELMLRGRNIGVQEALGRRLVDAIHPQAELDASALALARELAAHNPVALSWTKRSLRAPALARMVEARASGQDPVWELWRSDAVREAVSTFRAATLRKGR